MRTYQESDLFQDALAHHLAQTGNENHPRAGMWLAHHTQAVPRILRLLTLLEPQLPHPLTELQVLDLGCATGAASVAFAWKGCGRVIGLDPSRDFLGLTLAQQRAQGQGLSLSFVQGDGRRLPFSAASFDLCFCDWVIEHVQAPAHLLAEVHRVLVPGGMAYFSTNNRLWPWEPHSGLWFAGWLPHDWAESYVRWRGREIPGHRWDVWLLTWRQFKDLLIETGFAIRATWRTLLEGSEHRSRLARITLRLGLPVERFAPNLYFLVQKKGSESP
jgi:SAM-dependent methyltransferase